MFEELSSKFESAIKQLRGQAKISETNIEPALKDVRRALVSADVNLSVVDEFLRDIKEDALGIDVVKGITPDQKLIDIVHRKLTEVMGENNEPLIEETSGTTIIMLVGLQGAGKTTATAKLGLYLKDKGKKVLMVGADTFRPAAKEQLKTLGKQNNIDVFTGIDGNTSKEIAVAGIRMGTEEGFDNVIVDTAGRLYIDKDMMNEVSEIKRTISPQETLLVVDAMIGQEAADLTRAFNEQVGITGAILTKMDGDSKGGAALSIKKISGKPIKLIGTGEKVEALEPFYPERMAGRILGMGDILSLVDKAQKEVEINDVLTIQKKFQDASFDFNDFLQQLKLIRRMGSLGGIMKLIPGMNKIDDLTMKAGENQLKRFQSMIGSMTKEEKLNPDLLVKSSKRRKRVAMGSGYDENDVDKMVSDFARMRKMMQGITKGKMEGMLDIMKNPGDSLVANNANTKVSNSRDREALQRRFKASKKKKGFFDL